MLCPFYGIYLESQKKNNCYRFLRSQSAHKVDFSSNDYLCFSKHPRILEGAYLAGQTFGCGATGSHLLSGRFSLLETFEKRIAQDKKTEAALLFSSGFAANSAVLSCLLDASVLKKEPLVFFDKHNHASLYQGVFLSKARLMRFRHNDMQHLSELLCKTLAWSNPKFIVTETVFGMDGDCAPLDTLTELASKHGAFLYLDEAHATGMMGEEGYGLSSKAKLVSIPHAVMGTFSKALGTGGAYIASSRLVCDYLINRASGFMFTTAPSPLVVGAAHAAWCLAKEKNTLRKRVLSNALWLQNAMKNRFFDIGVCGETWIVPWVLGSACKAQKAQKLLELRGFSASCVRPPTVAPQTSRLRFAVTARHTRKNLSNLVTALEEVRASL